MTILLLTHSYPDTLNRYRGIFVQEQVKALGTIHDVIVVYFKTDYSHFALFSDYSFVRKQAGRITEYEVTTGRSFPVLNQLKYLMNTWSFIKKEILQDKKIDIIHSHLSYPAGFLGAIIGRKLGIPSFLTEHSVITKYNRSFIHRICVRYALRNSGGVISVSTSLQKEIRQMVNREVSVIPNVIDFEKFRNVIPEKEIGINIGFLGSMDNYNKGLDLLLKAVANLNNRDVVLHIGGKGKLQNSFVKMTEDLGIKENCRFYGGILPEKITEFYSKLDFFVLASRYETFGIVLVEAMACGLPVIATRCGGPEDIVTPGTGILISKDNIPELMEAISFMSGNLQKYDPDLIRIYVNEKFGQKAFLEKITQAFTKISKQPAGN